MTTYPHPYVSNRIMHTPSLLTRENAKTPKGEKYGYSTAILYLMPAKSSGIGNLCPNASAGCKLACLHTAGLARIFSHIIQARQRKTELFYNDRPRFLSQLHEEIVRHTVRAHKYGLFPTVRLNGTSDYPWERHRDVLMDSFENVVFYDYTKSPKRMEKYLNKEFPENYHLVFSRSETNENDCLRVLTMGGRVAVVFEQKPKRFWGYKVVDGDQHDLTFLHKPKTIIGLKPKGRAKKDRTGFVVR